MSIDCFFNREYDRGNYNCLHHAAEVWKALVGEDILDRLAGVLSGVTRHHVRGFKRLETPVTPCLALLRRKADDLLHVGVYIDRRILHISARGVEFQPVDVVAAGFTDLRWYR